MKAFSSCFNCGIVEIQVRSEFKTTGDSYNMKGHMQISKAVYKLRSFNIIFLYACDLFAGRQEMRT